METSMPITVKQQVPIIVAGPKKVPITIAFATFHFKNSLQIICSRYQFKNYMNIISYIFCISSYKNKVENDIGKTSSRVG